MKRQQNVMKFSLSLSRLINVGEGVKVMCVFVLGSFCLPWPGHIFHINSFSFINSSWIRKSLEKNGRIMHRVFY